MFSNRSGTLKVLQQSLPVLSDFVLSSQPSCPHLVPSSQEHPTYSFCTHCSPHLGTFLSELHREGFLLPSQSQVGRAPHHSSSQYHLICPRAHMLLATTSIDLFTCLWSYFPEGESKLYIMNSVLPFLPLASVPRTESGTWWILSKYLLVENFISISLSESPESF